MLAVSLLTCQVTSNMMINMPQVLVQQAIRAPHSNVSMLFVPSQNRARMSFHSRVGRAVLMHGFNMQGQDDNDATLLPLRDVHAINSRIEFGSVPISPVEVCNNAHISIVSDQT